MAPKKTIRLPCDPETARAFADAIRRYAEAAYPTGGSECAQVAHQALTDSARTIAEAHRNTEDGTIEFPRRQRTMLKAALDWYLVQADVDLPDTVRTRLSQLLSRPKSL
jgi:hypothetical protein